MADNEAARITELKNRVTGLGTASGGGGAALDANAKKDIARAQQQAIDEIRALKGTYP